MPAKFWRKRGGLPVPSPSPTGGAWEYPEGERPSSEYPPVVRPASYMAPVPIPASSQESPYTEGSFRFMPEEEDSIEEEDTEGTPLSRAQERARKRQSRMEERLEKEELKAQQAEAKKSYQEKIEQARQRRRAAEGPGLVERTGKVAKKAGLAVAPAAGAVGRGLGTAGLAGLRYGLGRYERGVERREKIQEARGLARARREFYAPWPTAEGRQRGLRGGLKAPALMSLGPQAPKLRGGIVGAPKLPGPSRAITQPTRTLPIGGVAGPLSPLREEDRQQGRIKRGGTVYWEFPTQDTARDAADLRGQGYKIQLVDEDGFQRLYVHPRIRLSELKYAGYEA